MANRNIFTGMGNAGKRKKPFLGDKFRIVLVIGIIALLAWNIIFVDWDQPGISKSTTGVRTEGRPSSDKPSSGSERRATAESYADDTGEGGQARAIIAQAREMDAPPLNPELFARADEFTRSGAMADAYLLHYFLVKQGYGPSAMILAEMSDPGFHDANASFLDAPNFAQAHKWYVQALMLGEDKADQRLAELKMRVKAAAAGGDENARRLLVGW